MPRARRIWRPALYAHVTVRGNNRQALFRDRHDFEHFLSIMEAAHEEHRFTVAAYCLMPNHVHLLLRPDEVPLSRLMQLVNKRYSDYFRRKYEFIGQVYQKRYFSKTVDGNHGLCLVSRYIHQNPVAGRAPLSASMEAYAFSSYQFFAEPALIRPAFLEIDDVLQQLPRGYTKTPAGYMRYCRKQPKHEDLALVIEKSEFQELQ